MSKRKSMRAYHRMLGLLVGLCALFWIGNISTEAQELTTSKDALKVPVSAARAPLKRALVIGLDGYTLAPPLRACQKDARAFATFLQTNWGFAPEGVTLITDADRPTASVLKKRVRVWLSSLKGGEEVVVFYSGHGVWAQGQEWLVPLDGDVDEVPSTCLSYTQLSLDLQSKSPRRVLLFTDACRNLAASGAKSGEKPSEFGQGKNLSPARARPEFAELRSCEAGQISQERPDGAGGVFTTFLLRALGGSPDAAPDGVLTFEKLRDYVERQTAAYVAGMGQEQNPFGVSSFGQMVLAQWDAGAIPSFPVLEPVMPAGKPIHAWAPVWALLLKSLEVAQSDKQTPATRGVTAHLIAEAFGASNGSDAPIGRGGVEFPDLAIDDPNRNAIVWAFGAGLLSGENGLIRPHRNVTRFELAMLLARLTDGMPQPIDKAGNETNKNRTVVEFSDVKRDHWAYGAIMNLQRRGIGIVVTHTALGFDVRGLVPNTAQTGYKSLPEYLRHRYYLSTGYQVSLEEATHELRVAGLPRVFGDEPDAAFSGSKVVTVAQVKATLNDVTRQILTPQES